MARTDLSIPSLGNNFIDLRDVLPGDAYNWSWERSLSQINYLTIHHTGVDNQTPEQIANSHININGWGGIGYHFLINKEGEVFYVGDISTARANVANLNDQVLGICLIGNFIQGEIPSDKQLDSAHKLSEFFIVNYPDLPNVNSWDKVRGHKELPNQTTSCPGDDWSSWRPQIVEGVTDEAQTGVLQSQIANLQTSLATINQQAIFLQETLQEREQEIQHLKKCLAPSDTTLTIIQALVNLYKFVSPPGKV